MVLQLPGLGKGPTTSHYKIPVHYEMLHKTLELASSCERGNEPLDSIKCGEFLD